MKTLLQSLALVTLFAVISLPTLVRAQDDSDNGGGGGDQDQGGDASFQTFYDQLGNQGNWIQTDDYGYVFQPNVNDPDWAPYTDGHWVYTDQGWTWASDESFGWATYHYGRWANIDGTGWVWVPGYTWAPAWVSWRYGGGYCGWAPLPPGTFYGAEYGDPGIAIGIGFHFGGDVDIGFNIGPGCYNFLRVGDMGGRNYHGHFVNRSQNFAIVNQTTNITNVNINHRGGNNLTGVVVNGPPLNEVNAHAHEQVQRANLVASNQPGRGTLQGNSFAVFAPRVNPASAHQARPTTVSQSLSNLQFNRGDSVTRPLAVNRTLTAQPPSAEAVKAAEEAQAHAPVGAKIATANTPVRTRTTTPFTSLEPVVRRQGNPTTSLVVPHNQTAVTGSEEHHRTANTDAAATGESPTISRSTSPVVQPQNQGGEAHHRTQDADDAATGGSPAASHPSTPVFQSQNQGGGDNNRRSQDQGNGGGDRQFNRPTATSQTSHPSSVTPHPTSAPTANNGGGQHSGNQSGGGQHNSQSGGNGGNQSGGQNH